MTYKRTEIGYRASATQVVVKDRPNRLSLNQFIASQQQRGRQIIDDWIKALRAAENTENPDRELLYKLYLNITTDADYIGDWGTKRKLRFLGTPFVLIDADGKPNQEATKMLRKKWFYDLMSEALESMPYGISLIEVKKIAADGTIIEIEPINRRHIIPEKGLHLPKIKDMKGAVLYREDPKYAPWLFEFGGPKDLGFLANLVPYVLFMRFAMSAWSEYGEKFVMPLRVAKTRTKDLESLNRLDRMMLDMATSSYAILDKDEEIEFIESSKADGSPVFDKLIDKCAAKISKIINGAVTGEASQGGSRSKEEVGEKINDDVTNADLMWWELIMDQTNMPKLISYGYPFVGLEFKFVRPKDIKQLWEITNGLLTSGEYDIPDSYITETFDIPVTKKAVIKPKAKGDRSFFG
jgi:phage gp29-like protein